MKTVSGRTPKILLVDDDQDLLIVLKQQLTKEGHHVVVSPNGVNIFDIIASDTPDLILIDIWMEGVEGPTLCRLLKSNKSTSRIPILMFSANDRIAEITGQCGADGFVRKPFKVEELRNEFARLKV